MFLSISESDVVVTSVVMRQAILDSDFQSSQSFDLVICQTPWCLGPAYLEGG